MVSNFGIQNYLFKKKIQTTYTYTTGNEAGLVGYWNFNEGSEIQLQTLLVMK